MLLSPLLNSQYLSSIFTLSILALLLVYLDFITEFTIDSQHLEKERPAEQ